jgi:selenocysteine lyase/cysteine desulfurase
MLEPSATRRDFLAAVSAAAAAATLVPALARADNTPNADALTTAPSRGLALAPDDFLLAPGLTYLQTGSLGPTPRPVLEHTMAAWRTLEQNPAAEGYGAQEHAMEGVRAKAAAFIGCSVDELVLTNCTTEGINWVADGLALRAGDRVLTTDQEHPGGRVAWDYLVRTRGIQLDIVPIAPGETDVQTLVDRFSRAITPRTRALSFSHLLSSTGFRMPVEALSALARSRECLAIVDGAQAVGGVEVDVKALGCHVYATSGHKWMLAPKGTGLLYLSAELGSRVDPIALQSGRAAYSASSGVTSLPSVAGLGAAIDYLNAIGMARIERHNLALRGYLERRLATVTALEIIPGRPGPLATPLLAYRLPPQFPSSALHARLRERHRVEVKVVPGQWFNGHRISTHLFNSEQDVDRLIEALRAELRA